DARDERPADSHQVPPGSRARVASQGDCCLDPVFGGIVCLRHCRPDVTVLDDSCVMTFTSLHSGRRTPTSSFCRPICGAQWPKLKSSSENDPSIVSASVKC